MSRIITIQAGDVDLNHLGCVVEAFGQRPSALDPHCYAGTLSGYSHAEVYTKISLSIRVGDETIRLVVDQNKMISVLVADEAPEPEKPAHSAVHFGSPATRTGKA